LSTLDLEAYRRGMTEANIDFAAIKTKQQGAWAAGNYAIIGATLQIVGESLCEALDLRGGSKVLDVCAGNGNATLAAGHRWCDVTSTDYVGALLELGKKRAEAEGQTAIKFAEADVENLPYADGSFDVVLSTFGVQFAPNQEKSASEMLRVVKSGGKIGMANWTPAGFIGQLFKTLGKYVPPAPGLKSPAVWGTQARLEELFGAHAKIEATSKNYVFRYQSANHWLEIFRAYYGPLVKAFGALDAEKGAAFAKDVIALLDAGNKSGDSTLVLPGEYLEIVITKN
jgi:ubiquinone/menaquinone biosynthesis C-methylase UbiE